MRKIIVGFMILSFLFIISCEKPTNEEVFYEMQKELNEMEGYECVTNIKIRSNKGFSSYKAKHIFKNPNKYLIEYLEPRESRGYITLYNGEQAWLYNPHVQHSVMLKYDKNNDVNKNMFIGYFLRNFYTSETSILQSEAIGDDEYLVLVTEIRGNNKYRAKEKLWINKKNSIPRKLLVLDSDNNINVEIVYEKFKYNADLNEEIFEQKAKEMFKQIQ